MNESSKQLFNGILIIIGAVLLAYNLAVTEENRYSLVIGLIVLLIGSYRASKHWAQHKDDHLDGK